MEETRGLERASATLFSWPTMCSMSAVICHIGQVVTLVCRSWVRNLCQGPDYRLVVFENKPDVPDALHIHIQFPVKDASLRLGDLQFSRKETQEAAMKTSLGCW